MTLTTENPLIPDFGDDAEPRKMAFICSKGTLDMAYPALIMANGALSEGIETHIFFTFWGLDMVNEATKDDLQFTMLGNTAMHMPGSSRHIPQGLAGLPGMTGFATRMLRKQIAEQDVPTVPDFLRLLHEMGAHLWACKMSVDMIGLEEPDMIPEIEGVINVNEFIELADDAQIVFV